LAALAAAIALAREVDAQQPTGAPAPAAQAAPAPKLADLYTKLEKRIAMRDGVELFAAIYLPKDTSEPHPILMRRTPYSCQPYGEAKFPDSIGPSSLFVDRHYVIVYEDVRGCYQSGGTFDDMRPELEGRGTNAKPAAGAPPIDEATDTYDTIDWL